MAIVERFSLKIIEKVSFHQSISFRVGRKRFVIVFLDQTDKEVSRDYLGTNREIRFSKRPQIRESSVIRSFADDGSIEFYPRKRTHEIGDVSCQFGLTYPNHGNDTPGLLIFGA